MLRKEKPGKQKPWTEDQLKAGLEKFFEIHKKYPTAEEVDKFQYLPKSRTIQRSHGGLVGLRKKLGLEKDYRSGTYASKRTSKIYKRNKKAKIELYELFKKLYGSEVVEKDYYHTDDGRIYTDFYIRSPKGNFGIDIINASSKQSLIGCLNSKIRNLSNREPKITTILLINNREILSGEIQNIIENKTVKLPKYIRVESVVELEKALKNKKK